MRSKPGDEDIQPQVDNEVTDQDMTDLVLNDQTDDQETDETRAQETQTELAEQQDSIPEDTIVIDEDAVEELDEDELLQQTMRRRHVAAVRNKVYVFILGVVLFMFWPMFLTPIEEVRGEWAFKVSLTDLSSMFNGRGEWWILSEIEELEATQEEVLEEIEQVETEIKVIENLNQVEKQNTLIKCLNNDDCESIEPELLRRLDFLRIFIMIEELISEKMNFDQKEILRNIYEFLLTNNQWERLWTLQSINFGSIWVEDEELWLVSLPISLSVTFQWKQPLLTFLNNVENVVFIETPIMYVIESMNYNIVEYTEQQDVNISLTTYFFASDEQLLDIAE